MNVIASLFDPREYWLFYDFIFHNSYRITPFIIAALPLIAHCSNWLRLTGCLAAVPAYIFAGFLWEFRSGLTEKPWLFLPILAFPLFSVPGVLYGLAWWKRGADEIGLQAARLSALWTAWRSGQLLASLRDALVGCLCWLGESREHLAAAKIIRQQRRQMREADRHRRIHEKITLKLGPAALSAFPPAGSALALPGLSGGHAQPFVIVNNVPRAGGGFLRGLVLRLAVWVVPIGLVYLLGGAVLESGKHWITDAAGRAVQSVVENMMPSWFRPTKPVTPTEPGRR